MLWLAHEQIANMLVAVTARVTHHQSLFELPRGVPGICPLGHLLEQSQQG